MRSKEQQRGDLRCEIEMILSKIKDAQVKTEQDIRRLTEVTERRIERWQRDIAIKEDQLRDLVERPSPPMVSEDGEKSCDLCGKNESLLPSIIQMHHEEMQDWVMVCMGCYRRTTGRDMPSPFRGEKTFVRVSGRWTCCD